MKKNILILAVLILLSSYAVAVPASPQPFNLTQPDGTVIAARARGDEWGARVETLDGYTIVENARGEWVYADLAENKLVASYALAGEKPPASLAKHIRPAAAAEDSVGPWKGPNRDASRRITIVPAGNVTGTHKVLVILVNFTDNPRVNSTKYTPSHYSNLYFNASNSSSMYSFYVENSFGAFNFTGVVAGNRWYTSSHSMSYYGEDEIDIDDNYNGAGGTRVRSYMLICEALSLADADVNYSQYDTDSNGYIDHIMVVHADADEAATYPYENDTIWSVRWTGNLCGSSTYFDGKRVSSGVIVAEDAEVGTPAHEFGHDIGAVDLYDTGACDSAQDSEGIGEWGLMGSGNWLGSPQGSQPSHFSAWHKYLFGWIHPVVVNTPLYDEPIRAIESYDDAYIIPIPLGTSITNPNAGGSNQYFLIENRQKTGFDSSLRGEGLLIWHIDDSIYQLVGGDNCVNDDETNKGVDLEEADQGYQLNNGLDGVRGSDGDRGVSADTWKSNATGFTDSSTPNSRSKNGTVTRINVTDISASGTTMYADFLQTGSSAVVIYLEGGNVTPSTGNETTLFNWTVSYRHVNNTAPSYVRVNISGSLYNMTGVNGSDTNYTDGKLYSYAKNLTPGSYTYSFTASDGTNTNTTGNYTGLDVVYSLGPMVTLMSPQDNYHLTLHVAPLAFSVEGLYNISNCSLYLNSTGNWTINETMTNVTNNATNTFTVILADGAYLWSVSCTNVINQTNMAPANYTINIDTTAPTTPVNNISSYYNTAQINLSWSAGTDFFGIAYYIAQLANNSDFSNSVDRNTTNTSQISGNLTDGVTYFLRVKAVDGSGLSSNYSNTTNTTIDLTAPSAPANLSPSETSNDDTPVLSWSASLEATSGVSSYFVTLSNSTYSANQTSNSTSMQENVTLYDGHYNFSVRATDRAGNTGNASTSNFTVKTLFINEVSPNSPVDWIELYNIETKNYSLAGWRLGSRTANYTLTQNITGGSYLLLNATTTNLTLNAANDSVLLYLPNGTLWDNTSFSGILENNSFGRSRDGVGAFQAFNENQSTPGAANTQTLGITMQSGWNLIGIPLVI